jgi:DNA mismatch repair ATPase MutS
MTTKESLIASYNEKTNFFNQEIQTAKKRLNLIYYTRIIAFISSFALFFIIAQHSLGYAFLLLPVIIILFLFLVKAEIKTQRQIDYFKNRIQINTNEIDQLNSKFERFDQGKEFINKEHPYISDLDIFGNRSVFQLLNRTCSYGGRIQLARWLSFPFHDKNEIYERQEAIKCLSQKLEFNQQFIATGSSAQETNRDKDIIKEWLNETPAYNKPILKFLCVALPVVTLLALAFKLMGEMNMTLFNILFFTQLGIVALKLKKTTQIHNQLSRRVNTVEKYASIIQLIESENYDSKKLTGLKQQLGGNGIKASESIKELKKLVDTLDARLNLIVAPLINGIFLFDINVMWRIEKWKIQHKDDFLNWISIIAEFDAFVSLGMHAHNHPDYCYPVVETDDFILEAEQIGHPLILSNKLIKNNYRQSGFSKVDLLTGANMAGKSTFLRTIGVNLTLAMIGLPVCATKFKFTPILLFTSLRTNDSLQENESFFYAELKRLQMLMNYYENGQHVFFLLDEILKGTNSKDQHAGSEALIKKIIRLNGVGIVATHDVELSVLEQQLPQHVRNLCFEININGDKLLFDYTIKKGVCATMNASFLMKQMNIT